MLTYSEPLEHGRINRVSQADPLAGANFAVVLNSQYLHNILAVSFTLTTSITVASRFFVLTIFDGTNTFAFNAEQNAILASSVVICSAVQGLSHTIANNNAYRILPLPMNMYLTPLWQIRSDITNIQAADQISNIQVIERIWIP